MTCIGQSNLCVSSGYVHLPCTHQPTHEAYFVRSKSYSAVYFDSRGYFAFMDFYSTAEAIFELGLWYAVGACPAMMLPLDNSDIFNGLAVRSMP